MFLIYIYTYCLYYIILHSNILDITYFSWSVSRSGHFLSMRLADFVVFHCAEGVYGWGECWRFSDGIVRLLKIGMMLETLKENSFTGYQLKKCLHMSANFGGTWTERTVLRLKMNISAVSGFWGPLHFGNLRKKDATFSENSGKQHILFAALHCDLWSFSCITLRFAQRWPENPAKPPWTVRGLSCHKIVRKEGRCSQETSLFKHGPYTKPVWLLGSTCGLGHLGHLGQGGFIASSHRCCHVLSGCLSRTLKIVRLIVRLIK